MGYRGLSNKQFELVKDEATRLCEEQGLKTIGDFKRIGNEIIDRLESGEVTWEKLLA